jgi:hypothetical protein
MTDEFEPANPALSKRLLDQHDVVIDAFGGQLLLFPFDLSKSSLKVLESGCADGKPTVHRTALLTSCYRPLASTSLHPDSLPEFKHLRRYRYKPDFLPHIPSSKFQVYQAQRRQCLAF